MLRLERPAGRRAPIRVCDGVKNTPARVQILVLIAGRTWRARTLRGGRQRIRYKIDTTDKPELVEAQRIGKKWINGPKFLSQCDEGVMWARGWTGPAADALRSLAAMS